MKKILLKLIPYLSVIIIGVIIYLIANKADGKMSDLLVNISATFLAIPLLVLSYDVLKIVSNRKLNKEIEDYAKQLVDTHVMSIAIQVSKLIFPLDQRKNTFYEISKLIQLSEEEVYNEINSNKYLGFQIFKHWKISDKAIHDLLRNSLITNKIENEKIIDIIEILKSIKSLESILKEEELYLKINEKIEGYKIDKGFTDPDNPLPDRYMLLKHLEKDKYQVFDFGDIPKYNLQKCLNVYIINDQYKRIYSHSIFSLLNALNQWVRVSGDEIIVNQDMFRIRKY